MVYTKRTLVYKAQGMCVCDFFLVAYKYGIKLSACTACNCLDMNNYFEFSNFLETFIKPEA